MTQYVCTVENCGPDSETFYDYMESKLMRMTYWAHKAVLFEKIKQKIEQLEGEKLEKVANLLVEASKEKWETDKENEKKQEELRDKLKETFGD